jgi:hypothetical protein
VSAFVLFEIPLNPDSPTVSSGWHAKYEGSQQCSATLRERKVHYTSQGVRLQPSLQHSFATFVVSGADLHTAWCGRTAWNGRFVLAFSPLNVLSTKRGGHYGGRLKHGSAPMYINPLCQCGRRKILLFCGQA